MESDDSANSSHPPVFTKLRRGRRIPDSTEAPAKRPHPDSDSDSPATESNVSADEEEPVGPVIASSSGGKKGKGVAKGKKERAALNEYKREKWDIDRQARRATKDPLAVSPEEQLLRDKIAEFFTNEELRKSKEFNDAKDPLVGETPVVHLVRVLNLVNRQKERREFSKSTPIYSLFEKNPLVVECLLAKIQQGLCFKPENWPKVLERETEQERTERTRGARGADGASGADGRDEGTERSDGMEGTERTDGMEGVEGIGENEGNVIRPGGNELASDKDEPVDVEGDRILQLPAGTTAVVIYDRYYPCSVGGQRKALKNHSKVHFSDSHRNAPILELLDGLDLDDETIINRVYSGTTAVDGSSGRTRMQDDLESTDAPTRFKNFCSSNELTEDDFVCYQLRLPGKELEMGSTVVGDNALLVHPVAGDLEVAFISAGGPSVLNSSPGGVHASFALDSKLETMRDKVHDRIAEIKSDPPLFPPTARRLPLAAAADSPTPLLTVSDLAAERKVLVKALLKKQSEILVGRKKSGGPMVEVAMENITRNSSSDSYAADGFIMSLVILKDLTLSERKGFSTFYGKNAGRGPVAYRVDRLLAAKLPMETHDLNFEITREFVEENFGSFLDVYSVSPQHLDTIICLIFLILILSLSPVPVFLATSAPVVDLFLNETFLKIIKPGVYGTEGWKEMLKNPDSITPKKLEIYFDTSERNLGKTDDLATRIGEVLVVQVLEGEYSLVIPQMDFGVLRYDPQLEIPRRRAMFLVTVLLRFASELAASLRPKHDKDSMIAFRKMLMDEARELGLLEMIKSAKDELAERSATLYSLRQYERYRNEKIEILREKGIVDDEGGYVDAVGGMGLAVLALGEGGRGTFSEKVRQNISKGAQKQKDAQPKARGASNSSERRSQMKELIDALEESNARGFSSKGVAPPSCTFGDERWTTWILNLSEGADLIASATNYDRTRLASGLSFRGESFASVAESLARPLRLDSVAGWYHSVCRVCSKSEIMQGHAGLGWHACAGPPVDPNADGMDVDTDLPPAAVPTPLVPATTTASKISSISILASVVDSSASDDARMDEDAAPPSAAVPTPLVPATTTAFSHAAFEATELFYVDDLLELYPEDFGEFMWMEDGSCRDGWSVESAYDILAANSDKISAYCSLEQLSLVRHRLGSVYTNLAAVLNAKEASAGLAQPYSTTTKGPKPKKYVASKFPLGRKETSGLELGDAWKLHQAEDLLFKLLGGRVETVGYGGGGTETSIFGDTSFWNDGKRIEPLQKSLEMFAKKKAAKESMQSSKPADPTSNLAPSMSGFRPSSSGSSPAFSFPSSTAPNSNTDPIATAPSRNQSDSLTPSLPSTRISNNRADFVPGTLALRICPGDNNGRCNALSMIAHSAQLTGFAHQPKDVNGAVHTLHNEGKRSTVQSKMKLVGVFEKFLDLPRLLIRFLHFASWNFDTRPSQKTPPHLKYKAVQDAVEKKFKVSFPMSSWSKRSISE